jgi:hypothetical protein
LWFYGEEEKISKEAKRWMRKRRRGGIPLHRFAHRIPHKSKTKIK